MLRPTASTRTSRISEARRCRERAAARDRCRQWRHLLNGRAFWPAAADPADHRKSGALLFESNTRSATIIGIVGAGGVGLQLSEQIRVLEWQKVSFLILMILVAVAAIDWISGKLRFAIIGRRAVA